MTLLDRDSHKLETDVISSVKTIAEVLGGFKFADIFCSPSKPKDQPLNLAQAGTPQQEKQVTGIPQWGQIPPEAKKKIEKEAIKRENDDHGAKGSELPASGTSTEEKKRARAGAAAKARADRSRLANKRELEPDSLGVLSATVNGFNAPLAVEGGRRGLNYYQQRHNNPHLKALQEPFNTLDAQITKEAKELAAATKGTTQYKELEERIETYKRLKLGQAKTADGQTISDAEMGKLESGDIKAFSSEEVARLKALQEQEKLLLAEKAEATAAWRGDLVGGFGRVGRGVAGGAGTYLFDSAVSSNLKLAGHDQWAQFMSPSALEIMAVSGTMTAPVPSFVPGAGGPWYARLGARALWEGGVDLASKLLAFGYDKVTDPDVEKRHLDSAKQAQADDHQKKTPESMNAAIDAWKLLGNHDNQIQQALDETATQIGTTDPAKLAETKRDLIALHTAFAEAWLAKGTRVGGPAADGTLINGPTTQHYIFEGKDFDFGGVALANLNTARNVLNELNLRGEDLVAKRVHSSLSESDVSRVLNPHKELPAIYDQLKTMVKNDDPDAKWLSTWLTTRVADQKKLLEAEESGAMKAKQTAEPFDPQFNNYVLAKVYQDQALLDMAYAAAGGQDRQKHLDAARKELDEAKRIGWDDREITVHGEHQRRPSDLPQLNELYRQLQS
jgi:hypothetical protein